MSMGERFGQYSGSSRALLPSSFTFCKITCTARRSDERVSDLPCQIFLGGPATHFQNLDIFGFSWLFGILFHVLITFPCSLTRYLQNDTISTLVTYVKNSWPRTVSFEKCRSNLPFSPKTLFKGLHTTRLKSKDKSPQKEQNHSQRSHGILVLEPKKCNFDLPQEDIVNAERYCQTLKKLKMVIQNKWRSILTKELFSATI